MRLSQIVLESFDRNASNAVLVGLLATPFPMFTQVEILTEGLSMSAFCWLAGALIRLDDRSVALRQLPRRGLVILLMVILVLIRSSFLPVALMTVFWVVLPVVLLISNQEASKQWWRLIVAVPVVTVGLLVAVPQAYLMLEHARIVREDPNFYGVGGAQLYWSMNVAKYSTSMIDCASLTRGGIKYPMPEVVNWLSFSDELFRDSSASVILWYLSHPLAFIIHFFEATNYDFPTAYVTLVNYPLMILFNIFSIYIFVVGLLVYTKIYYRGLIKSVYKFANKHYLYNSYKIYVVISVTVVASVMSIIDSVANTVIYTYAWGMLGVLGRLLFGIILAFKKEDRYLRGVVYLQLLVAVLWIQTGFTAVETRFGVVPWCAFAVLGAYGVINIAAVSGDGSRSGGRLLGTALGLAGVGLLSSQWILGGVVPVQEAIAAGC